MKIFKKIFFLKRRVIESFNTPPIPDNHIIPEKDVIIHYNKYKNTNTLTWLGHSTFIIKINNKVILTDPFLSEYASPFNDKGSKRFVPPGISIKKLPPISIILVTHDHFDHLDFETIKSLPNKKKIIVLVPDGIQYLFKKAGYLNVFSIKNYEKKIINNISFFALPILHESRRNIFRKKIQACSWAIKYKGINIYFTGDTFYSEPFFKKIGNDFGPFSLALVPIGSYDPPELLANIHITPEQAILITQDIRAKISVAMHWGTIKLSDEPILEPPKRFIKAASKNNINPKNIWILKIGETRQITSNT